MRRSARPGIQTPPGPAPASSAGGANSPFTVSQQRRERVTVTTITLQPSAGIPSNLPFAPAVSVAVSDGHLYLGLGDFAATALAQDPAHSLASNPRYTAAVAEAGHAQRGCHLGGPRRRGAAGGEHRRRQ